MGKASTRLSGGLPSETFNLLARLPHFRISLILLPVTRYFDFHGCRNDNSVIFSLGRERGGGEDIFCL